MTKLLVVDDEPQLLELLSLTLGIHGFEVRTAGGGVEALALASTEAFDLIILDVIMYPIDGFETARRYRDAGGTAPMLFLTGLTDEASTARGLEYGSAYLTKPFRPADLVAAIHRVVGSG